MRQPDINWKDEQVLEVLREGFFRGDSSSEIAAQLREKCSIPKLEGHLVSLALKKDHVLKWLEDKCGKDVVESRLRVRRVRQGRG